MEQETNRPPESNDIVAFFEHPIIQMALAVGCSILVLAWFSRHVLPRPIGTLARALPAFLPALYPVAHSRWPDRPIGRAGYWAAAVLLATALVIAFHAF